jgi:hypothetical protein
MSEEPGKYDTGQTARAKTPLTVDGLVAQAHANRQGISYETGKQLLKRLPQRLHTLADLILGGKMHTSDMAYAVAALIDSIESAPAESDMPSRYRH